MDQYSNDPFDGVASDDPASNRQDSRDSLFLMADMRVPGTKDLQQIRVRNLSPGGLMADYSEGLDQGMAIEFDVRGIGWITGHVAWSAAGRIGVAFDRQIDPMLARKPVGMGARTPVYVKPIMPRR
jgi:hypothetical protein